MPSVELRKDAAESKARSALKTNLSASVAFDCPEPEEPVERRYVTNDTSYERLGEILAQNPNGVLAHRDELVSLLKTLDREEFAAARGFFLTAWNGTASYKFDRITRGNTHIEAACLSLLGSTQPGRVAEYTRRAIAGGAADDGLIQRFGLLVWPDQNPESRDIDRYPDGKREKPPGGFLTVLTACSLSTLARKRTNSIGCRSYGLVKLLRTIS
jgi:putative DNA primase/helicase